MNTEFIRKAYHILQDDNLCFVYQGTFTDEMTEHLIGMSEYNLENNNDLKKLKKKFAFLMAESFQNIVRHGTMTIDEKITGLFPSLFMTRSYDNFYYITSANMVENKQIQALEEKLGRVNQLSTDELKTLYLQVLSIGKLTEKGGAGLGFIEMARKSGKKLTYEFETLNEEYSMFYFRIKMQGSETGEKYFPLLIAKDFYSTMRSGSIMMIYKGDFSRDSILPALNVIKSNLEKTASSKGVKKRVYLSTAEMLQNISKHGYEKDGAKSGMFAIGLKEEKYIITTANPIAKENFSSLSGLLMQLKSMDHQVILKEYKTVLKHGKSTETGNAWLGLLDIVRECNGNFEYAFDSFNEKTDLFLFSVTI